MLLDPWDSIDELFHILQQGASQQVVGKKAAYVGYIVKWFPNNTVIVSNPLGGTIPKPSDPLDTTATPNNTGIPILSLPMPLSTAFCGAPGVNPINPNIKSGIVLAPLGGAGPTSKDQALGEQVLVILLNNKQGYQATAFMMFDDMATPPSLSIPVTSEVLKPGEWLYVNPSGTHSHWRNDGTLLTYAMNPKADADGGNLLLFAGATDTAFGGGICLQTGLVNTVPEVPAGPGDIQLHSRGNIEMFGLDLGVTTTYSIIMAAGTHLQLGAALDAVIQSIDVGVLASNNFVATATQNIILNANEGNVGINALGDSSNFLAGAGNAVTLVAYNGDMSFFANTTGIAMNGQTFVDIVSPAGTVFIDANDNTTIHSAADVVLNADVTVSINGNQAVNLATNTAGAPIQLNAAGIVKIDAGTAIAITASGGDMDLTTLSGDLNMTGQDLNAEALSSFGITANFGAVSIQTLNGGDISLQAAGKSSGSINLTAHSGITTTSGGSQTWDCTSTVGSMTFTTTHAGHFVTDVGIISMTANAAVGIVSTTSTVTIIASGVSVLQGSNVILRDGSGNNPLQLMTIELINAFNNHTHGGVTTGGGSTATPDSPLSPGYPLTTDAALAN